MAITLDHYFTFMISTSYLEVDDFRRLQPQVYGVSEIYKKARHHQEKGSNNHHAT